MLKVNITDSTKTAAADKFYRYKRDEAQVAHSTKNGGTSIITNIGQLAKQLKVDAKELSLYVAKSMGAAYKIQESKLTLKGTHTTKKIEEIINKFIVRYVLCPKCKLPELVSKSCLACGYTLKKKNKTEASSSSDDDDDNTKTSDLDKKLAELIKALDLKTVPANQKQVKTLKDRCWICETEKEYALILAEFKKNEQINRH